MSATTTYCLDISPTVCVHAVLSGRKPFVVIIPNVILTLPGCPNADPLRLNRLVMDSHFLSHRPHKDAIVPIKVLFTVLAKDRPTAFAIEFKAFAMRCSLTRNHSTICWRS